MSSTRPDVTLTTYIWSDSPILMDGGKPETFRPAAAILGYGIYDYHLIFGEIPDPFAQAMSEAAGIAFFGTKSPTEEMLDAASPAFLVTKNTPPTFLWATAADELVPVENTTQMANTLAQAGCLLNG
jgi:hypothetical protein